MKPYILIILLSTIFLTQARAQVLEKTIEKFKLFKNLSYTETKIEKDLFSEDLFYDTIQAIFDFSHTESLYKIYGNKIGLWNHGSKIIRFDLEDKTYKFFSAKEFTFGMNGMPLPQVIQYLEKDLQENLTVQKLKDTVLFGKQCYQYQILKSDSLEKDKSVYSKKKIVIDKETYLPAFYRWESQGFIDGTDILIKVLMEHTYQKYKIDEEKITDLATLTIPSDFSLEVPKERLSLLERGTIAPELALLDSLGSSYKLAKQKGKVILLNFSTVGCPHSIEAIEALNDIHKSFRDKDFEIVTIFAHDKEDAIKEMNKRFHVKFPYFKSPENVKVNLDNYGVDSYPTFYILDKNGAILQGFEGYSKSIGQAIKTFIKKNL